MTSLDDCRKWLKSNGYDESIRLYENGMVLMLHEFSKTTVGHFPAEEEKQKAFESGELIPVSCRPGEKPSAALKRQYPNISDKAL